MNYLRAELTGKTVSVIKSHFDEKFQKDIEQGFVCEAGNGCHSFTFGEKIFGYWVATKEKDTITGRDVESIIENQKATA